MPATRVTRRRPRRSARPTRSPNSGRAMLRTETKSRARALQLLYAWELRGAPPIPVVAGGLSRLTGPEPTLMDRAEELAAGVVAEVASLDAEAARVSENWR